MTVATPQPLVIDPSEMIDGFTRRYGPYLVQIGNVLIEFEDHTYRHALHVEVEWCKRRMNYLGCPSGIAPHDITVTLESEDAEQIGEIYSKRPDSMHAYTKAKSS